MIIFIGGLISWLLENAPVLSEWFHELPANQRRIVVIIVSIAVAIGTNLIACSGYESKFDCLGWDTLLDSIVTWAVTQAFHLNVNEYVPASKQGGA